LSLPGGAGFAVYPVVMPWRIARRNDLYCVIKTTDDTVEKCYDNADEALDLMAALYAAEEDGD